jgi:HAD superfamily hydrolase (TIGR01450 family)
VGAATIVLDLDGVVWLAGQEIPGASRAVELLRTNGRRVLFVTNNSSPTLQQMRDRLGRIGIEADDEEIITAAIAAASVLLPASSAHVIGDRGVHEAVERAGVTISTERPDAVVVGWERSFTFDGIALAATNIRSGARFIATNDDPTHPTAEGLLPGTGALVAAIATAAEATPLIAGKPGRPTIDLILQRSDGIEWCIGDRPSTDGALAAALGVPFGLVRSEATPVSDHRVDQVADSLLELVEGILA